jgi:alpha-L-fucosidase
LENKHHASPWYTDNEAYRKYWADVMRELIDMFTPDLLYSDGSLPFGGHWQGNDNAVPDEKGYKHGLDTVAYLYNASAQKHGNNRAVYTQKDRRPDVYRVGVLDIEKSQLPGINPEPWQTDTCIGNWFYDVRQKYKQPDHIVEMLVDIISKNGTMLLNVLQKPDGTIDDEAKFILKELAAWFDICSEGVYGTRPWRTPGEGMTKVHIEGFREDKTEWNVTDFRFVKRENTVYAFMMAQAYNGAAVIRSFNNGERITGVRLLGYGNVEYVHEYGVLTVKLPDKLPAAFANCLAVTLG